MILRLHIGCGVGAFGPVDPDCGPLTLCWTQMCSSDLCYLAECGIVSYHTLFDGNGILLALFL